MVGDAYHVFARYYDAVLWGQCGELLVRNFDRVVGRLGSGRRHLDIGCGTGRLMRHALDAGYCVTGIDISPAMVQVATEQAPEAAVYCADAMDMPAGLWDVLTANNDVLNHLVSRHGCQCVFDRWAGMMTSDGVALTDVVSVNDVRENWDGLEHEYSDGVSFRCRVTHELVDRCAGVGRMVRTWWSRVGDEWIRRGSEEELVRGVHRDELETAARGAGLMAEFWDWDKGRACDKRTVRIGVILKRSSRR